MKRALIVAVGVLALAFLLRYWWHKGLDQEQAPLATSQAEALPKAPDIPIRERSPAPPSDGPILLAKDLNRADGTIAKDLRVVEDLLDAWRSNFPRSGNPWGENAEISASLTGQNPLHLVLIPRDHIAFNSAGELCDRWGTPFRFHALSGSQMEVRSAGPDKKFGTPDDATLSP